MLGKGKNGKTVLKSWAIAGVMLVGVMAIGGCGSTNSTAASASSSTQQSASAQNGQGQKKNLRNPALQAAMEIRRLQADQQMVLTSDQKDKIKPILQELINTANPSDDFLKQKADAINAVFSDQQKNYLTSHNQRNNKNGNPENGQAPNGASSKDNSASDANSKNQQNGASNNNQSRQPMQPQDIYKQVLNSLS